MTKTLSEYYRSPDNYASFRLNTPLSPDAGYFQWGEDTVCYGRSTTGHRSERADAALYNTFGDTTLDSPSVCLPFDPAEVIENLLRERYTAEFREPGRLSNLAIRKIYYRLRPFLAMPIRKRLQKIHLRNWHKIPFPQWPVDSTVDRINRRLMALAIRAQGLEEMPFIWFWPQEFTSCVIITHDVENSGGRDFCRNLMDLDESFGFYSSFQVVPEDRYAVPESFLQEIAGRQFEVNVHDLNHDGRLYADYEEFRKRATQINQYARRFGAVGFRSGILYRNADWYDAFDFSYDMSIPNVGHLDPQRGGCCTVMPYFIGKMVELPLTCTQDHTLFNILDDYSIDLWKRQVGIIKENHGLVTILVHPDYVIAQRPQAIYRELLKYLADLRDKDHMWAALPRDVANWWRERSEMKLVKMNGSWAVEGPGSERARVAYARVSGDTVTYSIEPK
ncbi:MAG TPA: hypothetical protein VGG45_13425 [Terracidiphilus sp.]|jgi:hypothetical protein